MKKTVSILTVALLFATKSFSQNVSDTLIVKIDTTTFKNIIAIIQKQLDSKAASSYILEALSKYELVMEKPKQQLKK